MIIYSGIDLCRTKGRGKNHPFCWCGPQQEYQDSRVDHFPFLTDFITESVFLFCKPAMLNNNSLIIKLNKTVLYIDIELSSGHTTVSAILRDLPISIALYSSFYDQSPQLG